MCRIPGVNEVDHYTCWYKVDNFYFVSCLLELYFHKNKKLLYIKEYCHDGDTVMRTVCVLRAHMDWSAHYQPFQNLPNYLNNCQLL